MEGVNLAKYLKVKPLGREPYNPFMMLKVILFWLFVKCWGMTPIYNELREIRKYLLFLFFNLNVIYDFLL
jgi:hypothetical protein